MAITTFDFSEMTSSDYLTIPAGKYPARLIKQEDAISKNGNEQVIFTFEITEDKKFQNDEGEEATTLGRQFKVYAIRKGNTFKMYEIFLALGVPVPADKTKAVPVNLDNYLNKEVWLPITVKPHYLDEDKTSNEVGKVTARKKVAKAGDLDGQFK